MPAEGTYTLRRIARDEFIARLTRAYESAQLESHVGYEQNLKLVAEWCNIRLRPDRGEVRNLADGDELLVMKLKYRVQDTTLKADKKFQSSVSADDFEFFVAEYKRL
jgi:hypothetical protein